MPEIVERNDARTAHKGRSHWSIARTVWGAKAEVRYGSFHGDGVRDGMIVKPDRNDPEGHRYIVLAHVVFHD